jgi:hypothetical protein
MFFRFFASVVLVGRVAGQSVPHISHSDDAATISCTRLGYYDASILLSFPGSFETPLAIINNTLQVDTKNITDLFTFSNCTSTYMGLVQSFNSGPEGLTYYG